MPTASASAVVPPSQAAATPLPVTATFATPATANADEVMTPELSTRSSPAPASIPIAVAVAVASDIDAERPLAETATLSDGAAALDVAVIEASLVMSSSPRTTVDEITAPTRTSSAVT